MAVQSVLNPDILAIIQYANKHKLCKHTIRQDSSAGSHVWDGHKIFKQRINAFVYTTPLVTDYEIVTNKPSKKDPCSDEILSIVLEICTKPILSKHFNISFSNCTILSLYNKCLLLCLINEKEKKKKKIGKILFFFVVLFFVFSLC